MDGVRVLLPRADIGREVIADQLREAGAAVTEVVAYRTILEDSQREGDPDIYGMLLEGRIDVVTFTSPSAVRNFAKIYGADQVADLLKNTVVATIGPVTADAARQLGDSCHDPANDLHHSSARRRDRRVITRLRRAQRQLEPPLRVLRGKIADMATQISTARLALTRRPRRLRRTEAIRSLVRETRLTPDCFILPLFVCEGRGVRREVSSMPGRLPAVGR